MYELITSAGPVLEFRLKLNSRTPFIFLHEKYGFQKCIEMC